MARCGQDAHDRCKQCISDAYRRWRLKHPDTCAAAKRRYVDRHREQLRASCREYHANNKEKRNLVKRAWAQENHDSLIAYAQNRRSRKRQGHVSAAQWRAIKELHGHQCAYCNRPGPIHMEHTTPLSRGGLHVPENVVPACQACNLSKGTKTLPEWIQLKNSLTDRPDRSRLKVRLGHGQVA